MNKHLDRFFGGILLIGAGFAVVFAYTWVMQESYLTWDWFGLIGFFVAQYLLGWLYEHANKKPNEGLKMNVQYSLSHEMTVKQLKEILSNDTLNDTDVLMPNAVRNLAIYRNDELVGAIDFLVGSAGVEWWNDE